MGLGSFLKDWAGPTLLGGIPGLAFHQGVKKLGGIGKIGEWATGKPGEQEALQDRIDINRQLRNGGAYIGETSPQAGNMNSLVSMLQQRASGQGPSLAADAYKQANDNNMSNLLTMSHG